tara:strand:- start:16187 stop:19456 length:3270 start_codon:yes stop_codon:yes gene_type:complete
MQNSENIILETPKVIDPNLCRMISNKVVYLQEVIKKSIIATQKYKILDIFGANELNICIPSLETIFSSLSNIVITINNKKFDSEQVITNLQNITNELSGLFKNFGTEHIDDLIQICFGKDYIENNLMQEPFKEKYSVMKKYLHPISYKSIPWKVDPFKEKSQKILKKCRIVEDFMIVDTAENLDCFDLARTNKNFSTKVYGVKFAIQNREKRKTLIISALTDDLMIGCLNYPFFESRINSLLHEKPSEDDFNSPSFNRYVACLHIKELLVYDNTDLYNRFMGYINQIHLIKQKTISQVTKEFLTNDLYGQRRTLIQLLLKSDEHEYQYLAYLLYDLLSNDSNGNIDTHEQTLLFDSLPWNVKKYFRDAMRQTITYTNNLSNFDNTKIPLEQQICLMKADDTVKEKAMLKLKEVKAKSEDTGSKARQYLDALLRIPFGIYREEEILHIMKSNLTIFNNLITFLNQDIYPKLPIPIKDSYSSMEVRKYSYVLEHNYKKIIKTNMVSIVKSTLINVKRSFLISNICYLNSIIKSNKLSYPKIRYSGKKSDYMRIEITNFIDSIKNNYALLFKISLYISNKNSNNDVISYLNENVNNINTNNNSIIQYMKDTNKILNNAVHGHDKAKRQIERIIGQWINGEKSGYCFGFEGPPGVGKTSLAKKGIAYCLKDNDANNRPFAFIAIGGSSNSSILDGHNYTYVGSTWGRIVDILMEKKCMNPIIFIDELDKVSHTEHGKEIIGILTHLIDRTQNESFQDKYFSGIDLDLSKALFIFSYNDVSQIDRVLLDRIHRIKFDHLSIEDKLVISQKYLLPEIYDKMGLKDVIEIHDDIINYIIEKYTCEPGVRKLKEILFEIVGEINLSILKDNDYQIPIIISKDDIKFKYLKEHHEIKQKCIHDHNEIGIINGLWANAVGQGGLLSIEASFFPSSSFLDLKLTGMQGDVMKESMTVAKTLAWNLLDIKTITDFQKKMEKNKLQGMHIHVPEGATPKDGPSAGVAITTVMYSLFTKKQIRNDIAITGEICLKGNITAIGGLDLKILGGIRGGVKTFIFPKENDKNFKDFLEKYENNEILKNINFKQVSNIQEVFTIVFET